MKPTCILALLATLSAASAFVGQSPKRNHIARCASDSTDFDRPSTFLDEDLDDDNIKVTFLNEDDNDDEDPKPTGEGRKRWENLNPKIKQRLIERGQAKAVANKKKREPAADKKRRMFDVGTLSSHFGSMRLIILLFFRRHVDAL